LSNIRAIHLGLGWINDKAGGLERYQHGLCSALARQGTSVEAWVQSSHSSFNHLDYPIISYSAAVERRSRRLECLRALARRSLPCHDTVFVSHHASVSDCIRPYLSDMPHVVHFHGPWAEEAKIEGAPFWRSWVQQRTERKVYTSADHVITLSEAFRKTAIERYYVSPERVTAIPVGINTDDFDPKVSRKDARERLGWHNGRPILLSVRRLIRRVGIHQLIDAVRIIRKRHAEVLVLIAGTGPLRDELKGMIRQFELSDNVQLLGFIPDAQLPLAYAAADYTVVPTQYLEGFGMVLLESLAGGTLPLVTPVGGLPEVCTELAPASIFDDPSSHAIADRVIQYLNGEIRCPSSEECRVFVRKKFGWKQIANRVRQVYEKSFEAKQGRR
jgi:glycosyltransferase involved in cell wall biosynthesis